MKKLIPFMLLIAAINPSAWAENGLVHVSANADVKASADRLEAILKDKGMTLFNRIDHAAGAAAVGLELADSQLLIFGNPKVGTKLMQCQPSLGLDLPLKVLIWQDPQGQVFLSYSDLGQLKTQHAVAGCDPLFAKVGQALAALVEAASRP